MITVAVLNRKGGVGKTTISTNLAQALGLLEKRVLVIDNDEQGNLAFSLGLQVSPEITLTNVYSNPELLLQAIYSTRIESVNILPGSNKLSTLRPAKNALKNILNNQMLKEHYDFCIIDNGPSLDEVTMAAVGAADHFILPVIPDTYAVQGLISLIRILEERGIDTTKIHILVNRYQNNLFSKTCYDFIVGTYQEKVLRTIIPNDNSLVEMVAKGKSLLLSKSSSKSVVPFLELLSELLDFSVDDMMETLKNVREKARRDNFEKHLAPNAFKPGQRIERKQKDKNETSRVGEGK